MLMNIDVDLAELEAIKDRMVTRIIQWANVNSGSYNVLGLERMAALLSQAFSELECFGDVLSLVPIEVDILHKKKTVDLGPLLRFWKRPEAPIQVLLVGHMDTVYGLEHPFQTAVQQSETTIIGPGVTDMKGGLCVMLESLKIFEKSANANQLGWEVLINPDEEIGSPGSTAFLAERAQHHQVGLLFEPAMDEAGTLAGKRKGSGKFILIVQGRAAHAGRDFHQGRNAIALLAELINAIHALNGIREGVVLNVGLIEGGSAINVVAAFAISRIDVRIDSIADEGWVWDRLNIIIEKANQREGFKIELKGGFNRKPKILTTKTQALYDFVAEVGREINQTITWKPSGGCSDGNNLSEIGLPNIDTLGVCGGKIHSDKEYMLIDSLISRTKLTATILKRLSEGKLKL